VYRNGEKRVGKSKRARLVIRLKDDQPQGEPQGTLFDDSNQGTK
jgi:hypothetical protein